MANTIAGRINLLTDQSAPTVGDVQPSLTPNTSCITKPTTKIGIEISSRDTTSTLESNQPLRLRPAIVPSVMPRTASITRAMKARVAVTGKVCLIRSKTGCPEKVLPKLKVIAFLTN